MKNDCIYYEANGYCANMCGRNKHDGNAKCDFPKHPQKCFAYCGKK